MKLQKMTKFQEIEEEIIKIISEGFGSYWNLIHAKKVRETLLELKPDADEALQIAALAHDIERSITGETDSKLKDLSNYDKYKEEHAKRSTKIIKEILERHCCNKEFISRVYGLVEKHEVGGSPEIDLLKDADSITFFKFDIYLYLEDNNPEKTKGKIKFMYGRLSDKAKETIKNLKYNSEEVRELVFGVVKK